MPPDPRSFSKILIVEGREDRNAIPGLIHHHFRWDQPIPFFIKAYEGVEAILEEGALNAEIKAAHLEAPGVVVADTHAAGRYQRIQQLCSSLFPDLPTGPEPQGVIRDNKDGKRFGVWIMPDNSSNGSMETFVRGLVPESAEALWSHEAASFPERARVRVGLP
ncbi:MAG: DUF3226 domain-containing protein [Bryobacteraceae bacterium]